MLVAGVVPALLVVLLRSALPESPRWMMSHGKAEEAATVISQLSGENVAAQATDTAQRSYRDLFSRRYI
jgi:hypothetical protein